MKYTINTLLAIFIFSISILAQTNDLSVTPPPDGSAPQLGRNIYWVHGLGGDHKSSWTSVSTYIQSLHVVDSRLLEYSEHSLETAGGFLLDEIESYPNSPEFKPPFVIAHSQGGLVARSAAKVHIDAIGSPPPFGGIVTFGTPHQGAPILSNVAEIINWAKKGCKALTKGDIGEFIDHNFFLDLLLDGSEVSENLSTSLCETFGGALPVGLSDYLARATNDYLPEAPYLKELNEFEDDLIKVAFYGIEDDPVFYRVASSLITQPESFEVYQANDDSDMINDMAKLLEHYEDRHSYYDNCIKRWSNFPFWDIPDLWYSNRRAYTNGIRWIKEMNKAWQTFIGVAEYVETPSNVCICEEEDKWGVVIDVKEHTLDPNQSCSDFESSFISCYQPVDFVWTKYEESDAIVPVSSASNFPGAIGVFDMIGSNHQQMRNDKNTEDAMISLLQTNNIHIFFNTPLR